MILSLPKGSTVATCVLRERMGRGERKVMNNFLVMKTWRKKNEKRRRGKGIKYICMYTSTYGKINTS